MSDPAENGCIEHLRPKTIPEQLVALATVSQVSEIQLKLQITGGILVLVEKENICQAYSRLLQKSSDSSGKPVEVPKLSQLFKKGQQYVCKIIERRARKGYADAQDIVATMDPTQLQEDNLPATIFAIPQIPIQGAIESIEDHGYRVDIGFRGLTGFLRFDEAEEYCTNYANGKKFVVGQIIRCCTTESMTISTDSRVIQLSMRKELLKKSSFTREKSMNNALTERCILPGSIGFLTVMKVQNDGLLVNFMDEFSGFVDTNHLKDDWDQPREGYKISDQLKCTVLYYNSATNNFCLSIKPRSKFRKTVEHFVENYHVGQFIKNAQVVSINGLKSVSFKVDGFKAVANIRDALSEDVATMNRDELHLALDSAYPDGSRHKCRIKSINYSDLTLVLSLRQEFLELPFVSIEELRPANFIEATISKYVRDGIVVKFGLNLKAIILNLHLHDYISTKSYKRYPIGKTIKCRVLKVDFEKHPPRVYLTNKEQLMDPELTIIDSYDKSFKGETVNAIVSKLKHDGIIVELFNNVKGFIPRRFCSTTPIRSVGDLFEVGQVTTCTVYRIEPQRQSLLMGIIPFEKIMEIKKEKKKQLLQSKQDKKLNRKENRESKKSVVAKTEKRKRDSDQSENNNENDGEDREDEDGEEDEEEDENDVSNTEVAKVKKTRLERSLAAKEREQKLREVERALMDPNRPAQSIPDFERLILKSPNSADTWVKYAKFFLDNVETEKARLVCRRALRTINFRQEKEKLKIWLFLIKIEAKYGGSEKLHEIIEEATQTNDRLELFRKAARSLVTCRELDEAERLHEATLKLDAKSPDVWVDFMMFQMEHRKDLDKARNLFERASKSLTSPNDLVYVRSRFAHSEFKFGDVERGKTLFETLLSENPKRMDLWKVYEAAIRKFGTRQLDNDEVRRMNEEILQRITSLRK